MVTVTSHIRGSTGLMKEHGQVGAGIQIPPNSTRLLLKLGLGPYLEKHVTEPDSVLMRRWEDGNIIGRTRLFPEFREQFDAPYWVVHRAHLHEVMHELAVDIGVSIQLASRVTSYDVHSPSITLPNGLIIPADIVIAADVSCPGDLLFALLNVVYAGVNSATRSIVLWGNGSPP